MLYFQINEFSIHDSVFKKYFSRKQHRFDRRCFLMFSLQSKFMYVKRNMYIVLRKFSINTYRLCLIFVTTLCYKNKERKLQSRVSVAQYVFPSLRHDVSRKNKRKGKDRRIGGSSIR